LFARHTTEEQAEIQRLLGSWGQGSFPSVGDSAFWHVGKHGKELGLGSEDLLTYLRKADAFNTKGARRLRLDSYDPFDPSKSGLYRYEKAGEYIIKDASGNILSYGKVTP
jgi:hypothetical protein